MRYQQSLTVDYTKSNEVQEGLNALYQDIRNRAPLNPAQIKKGMHIAVLHSDSIEIITVKETGRGRMESYGYGGDVAVAKISPSAPAMSWHETGGLHLMKLEDTDGQYGSRKRIAAEILQAYQIAATVMPSQASQIDVLRMFQEYLYPILGILWKYEKAVWFPIGRFKMVAVSAEETTRIWRETELENLIDDNENGQVTWENNWFYSRKL